MGGVGGFAHYLHGEWTYVAGPDVFELDFTAPDDGWASDFDGPNVYHYDGGSWSLAFSVPGYRYCYGISFCDRNNGWAVFGKGGKPLKLFQYRSGSWHEVKPPDPDGVSFPTSVTPTEAVFLGGENQRWVSWHWNTEPNVRETSLGRIKALFQ